uniref:C-type lectin 1b n=1 Tax=Bitis arietans TaxID=8692 RepID=A0A140DC05_BITAR|nr:C-type lectin 1b [Bitis arietans]
MGRFIFLSSGLLVVFLSLSGTGADAGCLPDWSSYKGHCYKVFKVEKTWADAEKFCKELVNGGHLMSVDSREEGEFISKLALEKMRIVLVWIGLSHFWRICPLRWTDGARLDYRALSDEPICFVAESFHNKWIQWTCNRKKSFVCKYRV